MDKEASRQIKKNDESCEETSRRKNTECETRSLNHLSIHQWARSAINVSQQPNLSYKPIGFLSLKLPPPPCAVLLVIFIIVERDAIGYQIHNIAAVNNCVFQAEVEFM